MGEALVPPLRLRDMDSRVRHVSIGAAGVVRPEYTPDGLNEKVSCLSCGRPSGYVTRDLPDGVVFVCDECTLRAGPLPLPVVSFKHRE